MKKKLMALVVAVTLLTMGMAIPGTAEGTATYEVTKSNCIEVTGQNISYQQGKSLVVDFDIGTTLSTKETVAVNMEICDGAGSVLSKVYMSRVVTPGKTFPIRYSSSRISADSVKVNIKVNIPSMSANIYVSDTGSNGNAGTGIAPLKTLSAAISRAAAYNSDEKYAGENVQIIMEEGTYNVEPMTVSGMNNLASLTIKGEGDVNLVGGASLSGFDKVEDDETLLMFPESVRGNLYSVDLTSYGIPEETDPINTNLYHDGIQKQIARYPNAENGYSNTATVDVTNANKNSGFAFTSSDIKEWSNYEEAWVRGYFMWGWDLMVGKNLTITEGRIDVGYMYWGASEMKTPSELTPWYIYNLPAALDSIGEYVIYKNKLYYCTDDINSGANILLNVETDSMLTVKNINNLTIENISFENLQGEFIKATENVSNLNVLGCTFKNNTNEAVEIFGDNNLVSSCDFQNIGGVGIDFGGGERENLTSSGSVIQNCLFEKTGQINRTNNPSVRLRGCGVTLKNNKFKDIPHAAISYSGNNHVIKHNEMTNCLADGSGDAGIIYTGRDLSNLGTVITNNYIHDSNSGLGAIYWDDRLSGQKATDNVFENVTRALLIHGGVCNEFSGNIVNNTGVVSGSYGAGVRGKDYEITVTPLSGGDQIKVNAWNTNDLTTYNSAVYNPFLANLINMPWQGNAWQTAYGDVLEYVNNKNDEKASETVVNNNRFVNVATPIYAYNGMTEGDMTNSDNTTVMTQEDTDKYNNIKAESGLYTDKYRTVN